LANKSSLKRLEKAETRAIAQLSQSSSITDTSTIRHPTGTAIDKYIRNIGAMNKRTAYKYYLRLSNFQDYLISTCKTDTLDSIITKTKEGSEDPYDILSGYVNYMQTSYNISASTLKSRIITAKNFLEYYDIDINPRKFKLKVTFVSCSRLTLFFRSLNVTSNNHFVRYSFSFFYYCM
jgi:hypothetical protein